MPIPGQRQLHCVQQQNTIDAVVADNDDGSFGMAPQNVTQRRRRARQHGRQGFSAGDHGKMRCAKPERDLLRPTFLRLFARQPLPFAIVDITEPIDWQPLDPKWRGDRRPGFEAPTERARVNGIRLPGCGDIAGGCLRLAASEIGQGQLRATAKPLGNDPIHISVTHQNDPRHCDAVA